MTAKLYYEDPYALEFEATVAERLETPDGPAVVLDATHFYPESGGQPYDLGTVDDVPVVKVLEGDGDRVVHVLERELEHERPRVSCRIDGPRRREHMQQHSGQHILSAAFIRVADAQTTSFHLGAVSCTIDLDKAVTADEIRRAEALANEVVQKALPIATRFVDAADSGSLELRKAPPAGAERLRIVEVEGFDQQACCGTHPRSTAEVGPVLVRGFEKVKGGTRVEFRCGERAAADYRESVARLRALASVLSAKESELVETATRLQDERKAMAKELAKLRTAALMSEVESWMEGEGVEPWGEGVEPWGEGVEPWGEHRVLVRTVEGLGPAELRAAAVKLAETPGRVALLGSVEDARAHLVFACSENVAANMGALLKEVVGTVDGRGGGSKTAAQGGGPKTDGLRDALARAKASLMG